MENSTIHIFGFGNTQLVLKDNAFSLKSEDLTTLQPLIDAIWNLKSAEVIAKKEFNVIHVFNKQNVRWQSNFNILVDVKTDSLNVLVDSLLAEMISLKPAPKIKEPKPITTDTKITRVKKK
jgi:hypothetical protein